MRIRLKVFALLTCLLAILDFAIIANAHPGQTDSKGGHRDSSTGKYHYHHGYGPHQHTDRDGDGVEDCPYDFQDRTGFNSGNSSSASKIQSNESSVSRGFGASSISEKKASLPIGAVIYFTYAVVAGAICIPVASTLDGFTNKKDPSYKTLNRLYTFLLWTGFPIALPLVIISGYLSESTKKKR